MTLGYYVIPGYGLADFCRVETKFGKRMCVFKQIHTGIVIVYPYDNIESYNIRRPIQNKHITEIYAIIDKQDNVVSNKTWSERYRVFMEMIKSGDLRQVAEVLSILNQIALTNELSFGERRMRDECIRLITEELSFVLGDKNEEKIHERICK